LLVILSDNFGVPGDIIKFSVLTAAIPTVQIVGYVARAAARSNTGSVPIYSIQAILILLAPPLYAASIYMVLGRLIRHLHAENFSMVPLKWMTGVFVTGDVIAFLMQAAGMSSYDLTHVVYIAANHSMVTKIC
jgi:hypothetical protein